jgi:hypothetical protein
VSGSLHNHPGHNERFASDAICQPTGEDLTRTPHDGIHRLDQPDVGQGDAIRDEQERKDT